MNINRKTAITVGVLYIIGTIAGIMSRVLTEPILKSSDYLFQISMDPNQIVIGALLVLTMGLSLAMVPVMMFPILKNYNRTLAIGYVVFRGALEAVTYLFFVIGWLALPLIGQEFVNAGAAEASYFQALGDIVLKANDQIGHVLSIVFILGALMFYAVLYQSKLVPRWLAGWGLLAATPYFVYGVLSLFTLPGSMGTLPEGLVIPLALQEIVLAVWLIARGFNNSSPVTFGATNIAVSQA